MVKARHAGWVCAAALLLLLLSAPVWIDAAFRAAFSGPRHVFQLDSRPKQLTEALALEVAQEALRRDGFDPARCRPLPDDRAEGKYLLRNTIDPNSGSIQFLCSDGHARTVQLELSHGTVTAQVYRGM